MVIAQIPNRQFSQIVIHQLYDQAGYKTEVLKVFDPKIRDDLGRK